MRCAGCLLKWSIISPLPVISGNGVTCLQKETDELPGVYMGARCLAPERLKRSEIYFEKRIGLNTGPVVAGIVEL